MSCIFNWLRFFCLFLSSFYSALLLLILRLYYKSVTFYTLAPTLLQIARLRVAAYLIPVPTASYLDS